MEFVIKDEDFLWTTDVSHNHCLEESLFDKSLKSSWSRVEKKGVLNYDVQGILTKIICGSWNLVAQLNPFRNVKRRSPAKISTICQDFEHSNFNFNKIKDEEILFETQFSLMNKNSAGDCEGIQCTFIVNSAPIIPFHSLIVPSRKCCKPQVLDAEGLLVAISSVLASKSSSTKVGFNSLGGMASVNHYHFHIYYLDHSIYVETAECERLAGPVFVFKNAFAPAFVFQLYSKDVLSLVRNCMTLVSFLLSEEVCHNVMITRGVATTSSGSRITDTYDTVRVCIWARKQVYGVKEIKGFSAALCELAGHVPVYDEKTWQLITEEDVTSALTEVTLETFNQILPRVKKLFNSLLTS